MTNKAHLIPEKALENHTAVLGKTGSGKTSTEKLIVEQAVQDGYSVCILDAIKSDWWGITSSGDGNKAGLPFQILGGPHGHVPLHSAAGAAIGTLVGSGKLPLSIIDMADFEAGGLQRFFTEFAPALMRSMKGVVYLVIEEAHEFAPKERSGIGAENMAIHWAKKLATAGRSKGIRLIVATQRVQSLHNAVLGSCETLIAHRLTTPADQEPILKWLKANTDKETLDEVSKSLSSLPTGTGWLCSGEAQIFKKVAFPKFKTYDNAKTPTKDSKQIHVKTGPVDLGMLQNLIGDAVKDAVANDPKALKAKVAELERQLQNGRPALDTDKLQKEAWADGRKTGFEEGVNHAQAWMLPTVEEMMQKVKKVGRVLSGVDETPRPFLRPAMEKAASKVIEKINKGGLDQFVDSYKKVQIPKSERKILTVLAQHATRNKKQIAILAGYAIKGGGFNNSLGALRSKGWIVGGQDAMSITDVGREALGEYEPLPQGDALAEHWFGQLDKAAATILRVLISAVRQPMTKADIASLAGYEVKGGGFNNALGKLRTLELIDGYQEITASEVFFK